MHPPLSHSVFDLVRTVRALDARALALCIAAALFGMAMMLESGWINERFARRLEAIAAAPAFAQGRLSNASFSHDGGRTELTWHFMANGRLQGGALVYAGSARMLQMKDAMQGEGLELAYLAHDPAISAPRAAYEHRAAIAKAARKGWRMRLYLCGFLLVVGSGCLLIIRD